MRCARIVSRDYRRNRMRLFAKRGTTACAGVRFAGERKVSTAPEIAFDRTAEFFSLAASHNHFQLLTALTEQASRDVDLSALIEGFVESVGRALRCDCACIALLDPEDSRVFREFLVHDPH